MIGLGVIFSIILIVIPFFIAIRNFTRFYKFHYTTISLEEESEYLLDIGELGGTRRRQLELKKYDYPQILFLGIAPILGFIIAYTTPMVKIFDIRHLLTLMTFATIGFISYWLSKIAKQHSPPLLFALLPIGLLIGILVYLLLFIHYISPITLLAGVIGFLSFPMYAPLPAILYSIIELHEYKEEQIHRSNTVEIEAESTFNQMIYRNFIAVPWFQNPLIWIGTILMIVTIPFILTFLGQEWYSIIEVFRGSKDFLLSRGGWNEFMF